MPTFYLHLKLLITYGLQHGAKTHKPISQKQHRTGSLVIGAEMHRDKNEDLQQTNLGGVIETSSMSQQELDHVNLAEVTGGV